MKLSRRIRGRLSRLWQPSLSSEPLPVLDPAQARGAVVAFYMANISTRVVLAQRRILKAFAPPDVAILQIETAEGHGTAMQNFIRQTRYRTILFLDIDCIPLNRQSIGKLIKFAEGGELAGAVQRASHIRNDGHLYVGPFCMALTTTLYREIGEPTFQETSRGDVGEELTYAMEERGCPVHFLWPTSVEQPIWPLTETVLFGPGTTYEDSFWHAFHIRERISQQRFATRCEEILARGAASRDPRS